MRAVYPQSIREKSSSPESAACLRMTLRLFHLYILLPSPQFSEKQGKIRETSTFEAYCETQVS